MQQEELLLIFVKNPEPGKVKTRLARTLGHRKALQVYKKLLAYTQNITLPLKMVKQVWYSSYLDLHDGWDDEIYSKKVQQGESLGERMKRAFSEAFENGFQRVVVIGSDCAELRTEHIRKSFELLKTCDVIVGPSADGGYYLLGMNSNHPALFDGIAWSTSRVLAQSLERIRQKNLQVQLLPELNDVDDEIDWNEVKARF